MRGACAIVKWDQVSQMDVIGRPLVGLPNRRVPLAASGLAAVCVAGLLASTSGLLPMTWDEGAMIARSEPLWSWVIRVCNDRDAGDVWTADEIQKHWQFTTQIEGHPALAGLVIGCGTWLSDPDWPSLQRARFGPSLLFAVAVGTAMYRLWLSHGPGSRWRD